MALASALTRLTRAAFPDHCSVHIPRRGSVAATLRRFAIVRALTADRSLLPLSWPIRAARCAGALAWPANSLARSAVAVRALGGPASSMCGRSRVALLLDCWWHAIRHNIAPKAYFKFRLFMPANSGRSYLQDHETSVLLREVRARIDPTTAARIDDKLEFDSFCKSAGLPAAEVVASCTGGRETQWLMDPATLTGDVVLKLTDSASGYGFEVAVWEGQRWIVGGQRVSVQKLADYLRKKSAGRGAIIQKRLVNHPAIRPLAGRGLTTLRILTAFSQEKSAEVAAAAMRMATGTSLVDNIAAGGLAAAIDTRTGALSLATGKDIGLGWFKAHPDSGAQIEGFTVPYWDEACSLCIRAHNQLTGAPTIGWDVVIAPDGALLLEGNLGWDAELVQVLGHTALGDTAAAQAIHRALFA